MSGESSKIYNAINVFLEEKRPTDEVAVIRFGGELKVISDFTNNKALLINRVQNQLGNGGGSPVYKGLLKAAELLRGKKGDRAIVLISDGANSYSDDRISDVWAMLARDSIRFYGVVFCPDLNVYTDYSVPNRARRVLRAWGATTVGFFAAAPTEEELSNVFARISKEFRQPSLYRITSSLSEISFGQLQITSRGAQIAGKDAPLIELIIDASGSMNSHKNLVDGKKKIDVAKKVLTELINSLPTGANVGVRVFGERVKEGDEYACVDVEVVAPYGPINRKALTDRINAIRPLGTTPIYNALLLSLGDLSEIPGKKIVVILTDGKEECSDPRNLPRLADEAKTLGVDLQLNIVGFALADKETKEILTAAAEITNGKFYDAQDRTSLAESLRKTFATLSYDVVNSRGETVASGRVDGPPIELREGAYSAVLQTATGAQQIESIVVVENKLHEVTLINSGGGLSLTDTYKDFVE